MDIQKFEFRKSSSGGYWVTTMNHGEAVDKDICVFILSVIYAIIFFSAIGIIALVKWAYKQRKAV